MTKNEFRQIIREELRSALAGLTSDPHDVKCHIERGRAAGKTALEIVEERKRQLRREKS